MTKLKIINAKMHPLKKKGQEELVGFVLIVVLLAIVFLVFITISFMNKGNTKGPESKEAGNFLDAMLEFTSNCSLGYDTNYYKIKDLIQECHRGSSCTSGVTVCNAIQSNVKGILDVGLKAGADRPVKLYLFNAKYKPTDGSPAEKIEGTEVFNGEGTGLIVCSNNKRSASRPLPGNYEVTLELCLGDTK